MDWVTFLSDYFKNNSSIEIRVVEREDKYYLIETYSLIIHQKDLENASIIIEINNQDRTKILSAYFLAFNLETDCYVYFNKRYKDNIEVFPRSFVHIPSGKEYELIYSKENAEKLIDFISIPLYKGWKEEQYFHQEEMFKTKITLIANNNERVFKQYVKGMEEDLPLPFDRTLIFVGRIILFVISILFPHKIKSKTIIVHPILSKENL